MGKVPTFLCLQTIDVTAVETKKQEYAVLFSKEVPGTFQGINLPPLHTHLNAAETYMLPIAASEIAERGLSRPLGRCYPYHIRGTYRINVRANVRETVMPSRGSKRQAASMQHTLMILKTIF